MILQNNILRYEIWNGRLQNHLNRGLLAMNPELGREKNTAWEAKFQTYIHTYLIEFRQNLDMVLEK